MFILLIKMFEKKPNKHLVLTVMQMYQSNEWSKNQLLFLKIDGGFAKNTLHSTSVACLTPECSAQDFRVEPFLVLANLWRVALRAGVDWVDVDHRALPGRVGPQGLRQPGVVAVA